MRLTAHCAPVSVPCDAPHVLAARTPGISDVCQLCVTNPDSSFWLRANALELQAQAVAAALCLGTSLLVTIHFILWCKKNVFSR